MGNLYTSLGTKKKGVAILLLSAAVRLLLCGIYLLRYGWHTTPVPETYFYYGVAKGTLYLHKTDLSYWLLHTLGFFFCGETLLYAVFGLGLIISSLTAVLVYMLAREILGERGGIVASLTYTFMAQPLAMGILLFTHDLVQMPILILFLYAGMRLREGRRAIWIAGLLAFFLIGLKINPLIVLAVEVMAVSYVFSLVKTSRGDKAFSAMAGTLAFIILFLILLNMMGESERIILLSIDFLSKIYVYPKEMLLQTFRVGSPDFVPTSIPQLWMRYNLLFLFLPFGIYSFIKKRNAFLVSLLFVGLSASLLFDRATRILDLAFAFTMAEAWTFWDETWNKYVSYSFIVTFAFAFLAAATGRFAFSIFLPFLAAFPMAYLLFKFSSGRIALVLSIFIFYNACAMGFLPHPPQISEAEYGAYSFLEGREGEWTLTAWDSGFASQAISGKMSFCSPANLDNTFQEILMKDNEEEALALLRKKNIDFIVVASYRFRLQGGRLYPSRFFLDYAPKTMEEKDLRNTLLFGMLYREDSIKNFVKIYEKKDESTGIIVKIFIPMTKIRHFSFINKHPVV